MTYNCAMHPAVILASIPLLGTFYFISKPLIRVSRSTSSDRDIVAIFPPMWDKVPSDLSAFPLVNNVTLINPWDYRQRLAIYKIMVTATQPYMRSFGPRNTGNILWGLPLQHGWQFATSRLRDFSNTTKCGFYNSYCISENSWWASMNYFLSVIPFLGSVNAGLYAKEWPHEVRFMSSQTGRYCTSVRNCSSLQSLTKWTDFFTFVMNSTKKVSQVHHDMLGQSEPGLSRMAMSPLEDEMLEMLWKAHVASIPEGQVRSTQPLRLMSDTEQQFGLGFRSIVAFIAAAHFQTDFNHIHLFQIMYLPPRLLWPSDHPPSVPDLTKSVNDAIFMMSVFRQVNKRSGDLLLRVWKRAMCSAEGRKEGRYLMKTFVDKPYTVPITLARLLWDVAVYPCDVIGKDIVASLKSA